MIYALVLCTYMSLHGPPVCELTSAPPAALQSATSCRALAASWTRRAAQPRGMRNEYRCVSRPASPSWQPE